MAGEVVLADAEALGEDDDRASLRGLVGERGHLRRLGQLLLGDSRHRHELGRLAVAEGDRAGLVEQQDVAVPGGLDGAPREGEDVAPHEPVHAGDPDRREQRPDRRRDQRHQQRDQRRLGEFGAGEEGEGAQADDDDHEDQRQGREQDPERDLVRRLAPLGALDEGDHPVEEGLAGFLGDFHDDPVREHPGAAGDGRAVAAGLADHRRRLAGDRRLVDRCDPLDHRSVAGNRLARLDDDDVAADQLGGRLLATVAQARGGLGAHRLQARRLGAAAALGQRLRQVREDDRQPEPDGDAEGEPGGLMAAAQRTAAEDLDQPGDAW